jgi:DNA polymerase/3'-5' exonuclease PolX
MAKRNTKTDVLGALHRAQKSVRLLQDENLSLAPESWQSCTHLREVEKRINDAIDCYLEVGEYKHANEARKIA